MTWTSPEPIAYFITWTTYGSWLPGDERGWATKPSRLHEPDPQRKDIAQRIMRETTVSFNVQQRLLVEQTVKDHCRYRNWQCHIVNCRTQHVHTVLSATADPDRILRELKSWCTRRLREAEKNALGFAHGPRQNWWTERGSKRPVFDENGLENVIIYVKDCQD